MIQLSPDTRLDGWDGCSAYHYSDTLVYGFSHTHLSGTGCSDYGDILMMPFTGKGSVINTEYAGSFSHNNEKATPGYYSVLLNKNNIYVELTTSKRVGLHRYTYSQSSSEKGIVLDLKHRDMVLFSMICYDAKTNSIYGIRNSKAWNDNQKLAFSILFSKPIRKVELYLNDVRVDDVAKIEGTHCKALIYFDNDVKEVVSKVAISANTEEPNAAFKNHIEVKDFDFDRVKNETYNLWNKELSKIAVETKNTELKKIFYTALYHAFTSPYLFTDVDGTYLGLDHQIHKTTAERNVYTVFSLWDTYRALHPLLNLIDRERSEDFLYTFMKHYEQGGMLPVWELAAFETWCMIGYHSVPVIYDAFVKGIGDYDKEKMLKAMVHSATLDKLGRPEFAKYGYIPGDMEHEDVSKTLEYAYDDWCIAQFAKAIGNEKVYQEFNERCQYYKNILDPKGFMHPKLNGGFMEPFNPTEINNHFSEGNSWQYSTYVPHDLSTLIELSGGAQVFDAHLDSLFHTTEKLTGREQADVTGLIGQYAHGNEPSHHAAYLYNYVGKPWKTQALTRKIMKELYTSAPDGLCGNEDCGQMSAWYVFSAMGFYPVCPGSNRYDLGSPIFDRVTLNLENGKQFVIVCKNQSSDNVYIKSAKWNGKTYTKSYITYNDIKNGGILELEMDHQPNRQRGVLKDDIAFSKVEHTLTIVPNVSPSHKTFHGEAEIVLSLYDPITKDDKNSLFPAQTDVIYYTLDESEPTIHSTKYTKPIKIDADTKLKAVAYNPTTGYSKTVEASFIKYETDKSIEIRSKYNRLYTAGGDEGLIDKVRGNPNFSLGGWQGYQDQDFDATVDLGSVKEITEIGAGFLQDVRSWIIFPTSVTFEISDDNVNFTHYGTFTNPHPYDDYTPMVDDFTVKKEAKARYIRVTAKNFGALPEWHLGAGYPAFIFIDEIIVK
jgi:predicted alpha-1,2-mannosidase